MIKTEAYGEPGSIHNMAQNRIDLHAPPINAEFFPQRIDEFRPAALGAVGRDPSDHVIKLIIRIGRKREPRLHSGARPTFGERLSLRVIVTSRMASTHAMASIHAGHSALTVCKHTLLTANRHSTLTSCAYITLSCSPGASSISPARTSVISCAHGTVIPRASADVVPRGRPFV